MHAKNSGQLNTPQAPEAMDKFRISAVGVNPTNGYNVT